MTRPFDKHLDNDELDMLVSLHETSVSGSEQLSEPTLREAQRHVESCHDCSRKLQRHQFVHSEILRMRVPNPSPPTPECMGDAQWLEVAAGLLPEAKTRELMKHAAQCGHCGPLLKNAAETIADEATPSEEALLASLQSARPEWRKNMAATLRDSVRDRQPKSSWWRAVFTWPAPAYAFAGIVAVAAVAWIGVRALHPPSAEQLLAQAYSEHRTLEVRIPGAKYAPVQTQRGTERSDFDKPQSLLKAEDLIGENLRKNPTDPVWLQARARADLLNGNYDSAIKSLERALETESDSSSLLTDLGSAYFVRAKSTDRQIDYGYAINSLGKALVKSPDDPIALFNRALACEQMFLYTQAVDDWEHYLRIDPQGEWAEEARKRLQETKEKVNQHDQSMAEPLLTPEQISARRSDDQFLSKIDTRVEEYLHSAIAEWLTKAFPMAGPPSKDSLVALSVLSTIMVERHNDSWLADMLIQRKGAQFAAGIQSLAEALSADDAGNYSKGREAAQRAALMLGSAGNRAAEIRAIAEQIYADHLSWESGECISLLQQLSLPLHNSHYWWLRAQMSLERSNCANQIGDMGTYLSAINDGVQQAKVHGYTALYLRGLGFEALAAASIGNIAKGFSLAVKGLGLFWSNSVEVMKGYNFYSHLDAMANELGLSHFQVPVCLEGTVLLDTGPNLLRRAMAHSFAGKAAYLASNPSVAVSEFSKARELFSEVPQTPATMGDRLDAEVWVANAEISRGDLRRAADILTAIKPVLFDAPGLDAEIEYYTAEANLGMRKASVSDLEPTLRSALFLAEWSLKTFPDEQGRRTWAEQSQDAYRDVVEWKLRQGDATSSLELWEWYKGAEIRAAERNGAEQTTDNAGVPPDPRNAPPLPTPTAVTELLPSLHGQTVVAFATFYDGIAVWVYDDRGVFSTWVGVPQDRIRELVVGLRRLCSDSTSNLADLRTIAHSLYDLFLRPIEGRFDPKRTLVLEPDGYLAAIPWEVLLDSGGRYLAQRFATVISPGAYWLMRRDAPATITPATPALVVSVPSSPAEDLVPLTEAEPEGQMVSGIFTQSLWLRGGAATVSAIRAGLRGKGIFHFVGHAIASPQRSGLVLTEVDPAINRSQLFTTQNLRNSEINALQLSVLSACPTDFDGRALETAEEGLPDTFLRAGVPHVVASRWNVDSGQTSVFMAQFYKQLRAGAGVSESMRSARLALASQLASAHPYYWSAFELEGVQ
ncbi:MAG TPA: CHAT domain-containing tetratricopeptide repeat protein [Candidatus Sulfotelmatobacter sp.]